MTRELTRIAIVGAGVMGSVYARAVTKTNLRYRAQVAAVCDADAERREALAASTGAHPYPDVVTMLAAEQLDMVYLATPDHAHRAPFDACMAARVPTLVEKPLATTMTEALAMRRAAAEAGVLAETNFTNRCNPVFVRTREAIEAGDIGTPIGLYARLSNVIDYPLRHLAWAGDSSCGWFLLSHVIDLGCWLTGWRVRSVLARGHKGTLAAAGVDTYDLIQALVTFDGGSALFESCWVLPNSQPAGAEFDYRIYGSDGMAQLDTTRQMITLASPTKVTYPGTLDWTEARLTAFLDRLDARAAGDEPDVDDILGDGVRNTATLVALHRSLELGTEQSVEQDGAERGSVEANSVEANSTEGNPGR